MSSGKNREAIGILGGTFDPVHNGHIALGEICARELSLNRVILIPTGTPPHKAASSASAAHRLAMCRLAAEESGGLFSVSDIESARPGKSYTVDTLSALGEEYPSADFFLIMGADMFVTLRNWYRFDQLRSMAVFCGCPRSGTDLRAAGLEGYAEGLRQDGCRARIIPAQLPEISSSLIRKHLAEGKNAEGLVPRRVERYIREKNLYR